MTLSKAFIAGLVCAVGVYLFAAVEGNNTAVVVRKDAVTSSTGWQYLAVPVRGFDITGQGQVKGIALADVLPPALYVAGTQLMVENNETGDTYLENATCTLETVSESPAWVLDSADVGTKLICANARIWVKNPSTNAINGALNAAMGIASAAPAAATTPTETIFAGEQNTVDYLVPSDAPAGQVTAYGNSSSETVVIPSQGASASTTGTQLVQNPQPGDQLLRIGNNRKSYIYYLYVGPYNGQAGYWLSTVAEDKFESQGLGIKPYEIAPGEAFYYYRAAVAN